MAALGSPWPMSYSSKRNKLNSNSVRLGISRKQKVLYKAVLLVSIAQLIAMPPTFVKEDKLETFTQPILTQF